MSGARGEVCWTVLFTGRVQGVGFRWTTRQLADGFAVTGTVRNLSDGRVELIAEGIPSELERFVDAIKAHFGANIRDFSRSERPATGQFDGFGIGF